MYLEKLADGNFATTPVLVGVFQSANNDDWRPPAQCETHDWATKNSQSCAQESECPAGMSMMHFQVCRRCGWNRVLLTP